MLFANGDECDHDRHADECAGNAPKKRPEKHHEQYHEWRNGERGAGDARLEVTSQQELDEIKAEEHNDGHLPGFGLRKDEQRRKDGSHKWSDERDIIERKRYDTSCGRQFHAGKRGESPDCETGHDAHQAADEHEFLEAVIR
jgi:hypothetical protein